MARGWIEVGGMTSQSRKVSGVDREVLKAAAFDLSPEPALVVSGDGALAAANEAAEALFGQGLGLLARGRFVAALTLSITDAGFDFITDAIRIFDVQTQQWSTLVEHRGNWGWPMWSQDSKFLYAVNVPAVNGAEPSWVYRIA